MATATITAIHRSSDTPSPYAVHANGWMPIIDHSGRRSFVRFERFPRNVKPTAAEATAYAAKVIAWCGHFAGFTRIT